MSERDTHPCHIPLEQCQDRGVYRIDSRNLQVGVYDAERQGFIGIREKFNDRYLFCEDHFDTGAPFGTVRPLELLGELPAAIELREREDTICGWGGCGRPAHFVEEESGTGRGKWVHDDDTPLCENARPSSATYRPLFEYLDAIEASLPPAESERTTRA